MKELPDYTVGRTRWELVPDYMIDGVRNYVEHGVVPGSFLLAVITNDLRRACECADGVNRGRLFEWVSFFYSGCPSQCWGSPEKVRSWVDHRGLAGITEEHQEEVETRG